MTVPASDDPAAGESTPPLVEMRNIVKRFANIEVLKDVSFDVRPGEVHALLGGNGAGKSTLMKILMGVYRADAGRIAVGGEEIAHADVGESLRRGVAMIFQELSLLPNLTVAQNIVFGREPLWAGFRIDRRAVDEIARAALVDHGFDISVKARVETLPFAQRQVVEIVRAASFGARVLIMDEPTSALTAREEEKLFDLIASLTAKGIGIVYISHRMGEIMRVANRITILRDGRSGTPIPIDEAQLHDISEQMSGSNHTAEEQAPDPVGVAARPGDTPILELAGLSTARSLRDINLTILPGEIVGIAGLVGSGRSTLCKAIAGLIPDARGSIKVDGRALRLGRPHEVLGSGIGFVPEDRRLEGLVLDHGLETNVALPNLLRVSSGGMLGITWNNRVRALFRRGTSDLDVVARRPTQPASELSGGNQQKVVVAKWLASEPRLLILDEPTAGVDIRAKADMAAVIRRAVREKGLAVLLINSELDEMVKLCDRMVVMERGRLKDTVRPGTSPAQLQALLLGGATEMNLQGKARYG